MRIARCINYVLIACYRATVCTAIADINSYTSCTATPRVRSEAQSGAGGGGNGTYAPFRMSAMTPSTVAAISLT